jgi:hypothetical protein
MSGDVLREVINQDTQTRQRRQSGWYSTRRCAPLYAAAVNRSAGQRCGSTSYPHSAGRLQRGLLTKPKVGVVYISCCWSLLLTAPGHHASPRLARIDLSILG